MIPLMSAGQFPADYFRFCPGEEQIKLSNAVCRGRRRSSFPKCAGCQFNDDEKARAARSLAGDTGGPRVESVFRAFDISATTPTPMSEEVAWRIGHAAAQFLHGRLRGYDRADSNARSIVAGRDLRSSSRSLQQAAIEGVRSVGVDVIDLGVVDSPQIPFAVSRLGACGGIQTTGGARPAEYNGFRLCGPRGAPVDENTGLASIRDIAARVPRHQTGSTARLRLLDFAPTYVTFIRQAIEGGPRLPRSLRVIVDACGGVAGRWAPLVFQGIDNLNLDLINAEAGIGFPREPDPRRTAAADELRKAVRQTKADLGVCFSPDADQCAFVDEKGMPVGADPAATLLARSFLERHRGGSIVLDLRCTSVADDEIERAGGTVLRERVGPAFIRKRMAEADAVFGADLAGRFYFRDNSYCQSALLATAHMLNLLGSTGRSLSDLVRPLLRRRSTGEIEFRSADPEETIRRVAAAHASAELAHVDGLSVRYADWRFHLRKAEADSLIQMTLEAQNKKLVEQRVAELAPLLGERV